MRRFTLTFDYLCPFARNANEHVIAALRDGAEWEVTWLPYSLAQGHVAEDETAIWDREAPATASGILALMAGVVVRDTDPERFLAVHEELFAIRHDRGEDLKDPEVVRAALDRAGVDSAAVLRTVADGSALATLRRDHEQAVDEYQVWGVPTFITGTRAVFVRVMDRPEGDATLARERIGHILDLVDSPLELHEFKQVDLTV